VELVQRLRDMELRKSPSISETLDWAHSLVALNASSLDKKTLDNTLSVLLKHETDLRKVKRQLERGNNPGDSGEDWDQDVRRRARWN
jgi:predicted component of type VI protein secretion system